MSSSLRPLPGFVVRFLACLVLLLVSAPAARAGSRLVVLPVVVGAGSEPSSDLVGALAKGLAENANWQVVQGEGLKNLAGASDQLKEEDRARIAGKLDEAARKTSGSAAEAVTALEAVRTELADLSKTATLSKEDHDLAYRAEGLLVAAQLAAKETDKAKTVAQEAALKFPGRKPGDADKLPNAARELLAATAAPETAKLTIRSRPEGCDVVLNGTNVGKSPVEVAAMPGASYQASAVCGAAEGRPALTSRPKRFTVGEKETTRAEVVDAEFERAFQAEGGLRVRFTSSPERRQLEDSYARRVAERYAADLVVLVSVGELSGADWLNGRLYLRSGYLNRQGLVRLEPVRAAALGRYLGTGREIPGVLRPDEAGALVAAQSQATQDQQQGSKVDPWYTDIVGWSFAGAGAIAFGLGTYANGVGRDKTDQADAIRGDSDRQNALYREASRAKFLGGIGQIGGGLVALTGIVLLIIPEYQTTNTELIAITPRPGGATVVWSGRF
jgi:hypothetical protein